MDIKDIRKVNPKFNSIKTANDVNRFGGTPSGPMPHRNFSSREGSYTEDDHNKKCETIINKIFRFADMGSLNHPPITSIKATYKKSYDKSFFPEFDVVLASQNGNINRIKTIEGKFKSDSDYTVSFKDYEANTDIGERYIFNLRVKGGECSIEKIELIGKNAKKAKSFFDDAFLLPLTTKNCGLDKKINNSSFEEYYCLKSTIGSTQLFESKLPKLPPSKDFYKVNNEKKQLK